MSAEVPGRFVKSSNTIAPLLLLFHGERRKKGWVEERRRRRRGKRLENCLWIGVGDVLVGLEKRGAKEEVLEQPKPNDVAPLQMIDVAAPPNMFFPPVLLSPCLSSLVSKLVARACLPPQPTAHS